MIAHRTGKRSCVPLLRQKQRLRPHCLPGGKQWYIASIGPAPFPIPSSQSLTSLLRWWPELRTVAAAVIACLVYATPAAAQLNQGLPKELAGVGVTEHPDVQIPLDLDFTNSDGTPVTLAKFFDGTRPVILTMNYSNCPRLCSVQLNGLVDAMRKMPWNLGDQYSVLTVTIDPLETPERAQLTRQKYLKDYGRPGWGAGWNFLVGREANIKKLADTVGFGYAYSPADKQYFHAAVLIICMPDGRVSRYLYKVEYDPQTLRLSLVEAGQGNVGSPVDQILLYCFHYSSTDGRYSLAAWTLMRLGGVVTLVILGGALSIWWIREKRKGGERPKVEGGEGTAEGGGEES